MASSAFSEGSAAANLTVDDVSDSLEESSSTIQQTVPAESVADVLRTQAWLEGQLFDQKCHMKVAEKLKVPFTEDAEVTKSRINELKEEMLSQSAKLSQKELILKRLQLGRALCHELFESTDDGSGDGPDTGNNKELEELVLKQSRLVSSVMKESAELDTLRDQLKDIRQKNFDLKVSNRRSMHQIRQRQNLLEEKAEDFSKHNEGQEKKKTLELEINKILIQRHTLQGLILGSGINWAEDPAMEQLLLSLGEPLNL